jgi:PBP1b-binding outer membrane lipoprotein LpoB
MWSTKTSFQKYLPIPWRVWRWNGASVIEGRRGDSAITGRSGNPKSSAAGLKPIKTMKPLNILLPQALAPVLLLLLVGCVTGVRNPSGINVTEMKADERGFVTGTGIESQDLVAVTDKMARSIVAVPVIANAQGAPRVVLEPVQNETRFTINKEIFLTRIRAELNAKAGGKVRFLDRERMFALERERELKQSGQVTSSSDPNVVEFKGADFFLTGKLQGMTSRTSRGTSDYVLYAFQLIDARTSDIVWEGSAEIKKQGLEDASYR